MKAISVSVALLLAANQFTAKASTIGIVDSGLDIKHPALVQQTWVNPGEIAGNNLDDDQDGYIDDTHGWNFVENSPVLLDSKYLNTFPPEIPRFFEIQKKMLEGTSTEDERNWLKENIQNPKFRGKLQVFGNFVHGTHVAGITARKNPQADVLGIKLIPTENPLAPQNVSEGADNKQAAQRFLNKVWDVIWPVVRDIGLRAGLSKIAEIQSAQFNQVALYLNDKKADVANYSLGVSTTSASLIVKPILKAVLRREPTAEEINTYASFLVSKMVERTAQWTALAPNTLFVIAAGNDGTNNDLVPTSPANVRAANTITVAATLGRSKIASFSNYGRQMVDVAAPGVGITSAMPGGGELILSGTSQAAPAVAQAIGAAKDENPELTFFDLKRIILETVDVRPWLADKVKTSGIVNHDRAVRAAQLSKTLPLANAIAQARTEVADLETPYEQTLAPELEKSLWVPALPLGL